MCVEKQKHTHIHTEHTENTKALRLKKLQNVGSLKIKVSPC